MREGQEVTRETFQFRVDKKKLRAAEVRDGHCGLVVSYFSISK